MKGKFTVITIDKNYHFRNYANAVKKAMNIYGIKAIKYTDEYIKEGWL
jgi:3'-phosphoadenosine 5'-phosphosulfate sulfotransferase (PAPS reductase)/FAD synthetase